MNILKLAKECEIIFDTSEQIEAFAQAVIEDYKASLVPVAHIDITKRLDHAPPDPTELETR